MSENNALLLNPVFQVQILEPDSLPEQKESAILHLNLPHDDAGNRKNEREALIPHVSFCFGECACDSHSPQSGAFAHTTVQQALSGGVHHAIEKK